MKVETKFLNIVEAANLLHLKVSTLYAWVHGRKIPHRKHGSKLVFSLEDLLAWSDARCVECGTTSPAPLGAGSLKTRRTVETP
jgi:excisionase family DNA binding protein